MKKIFLALFLSVFLILSVFSISLPVFGGEAKISPEVGKIIDNTRYKYSSWGILVVDLETDEILESLNPDLMFSPGSTTKLFTVAAALDVLGADYRFRTPVYIRGKVNESGELDGDLILVGTGDINMGGRTTPSGHIAYTNADHTDANALGFGSLTDTDPLAGLDSLARQVAKSGIKSINGDIRPSKPGELAKVEWRPRNSLYQVDIKIKTVGEKKESSVIIKAGADGLLVVDGQISAATKEILHTYSIKNPARFARSLFIEALRRAGVKVSASEKADNNDTKLPPPDSYKKLKRVALLESPPFSQFARLILKISHNMGADTLVDLIAVHSGKQTFEEGLYREGAFLKKAGIDVDSISLADGEGGVVTDKISPRAAVRLLKYMKTRKDFKAYFNALPILGVDGSLANAAPKNSPATGKVRAKTGTTAGYNGIRANLFLVAKGLAGYITTAKGRKIAFAVYINNLNVNGIQGLMKVGNVLGKIAEVIYLRY